MSAPEGWYFDSGDHTVGIFGDAWYHDPCPLDDGPAYAGGIPAARERVVSTTRMPTGEVTIEVELTCSCGATTTVFDYDFDPDDEAVYTDDVV